LTLKISGTRGDFAVHPEHQWSGRTKKAPFPSTPRRAKIVEGGEKTWLKVNIRVPGKDQPEGIMPQLNPVMIDFPKITCRGKFGGGKLGSPAARAARKKKGITGATNRKND